MWQKCPICNGTGIAMTVSSSNSTCPTCQGMRIISEVNGLPPASVPPAAHTGNYMAQSTNVPTGIFGYGKTTNTDNTDFRDAPMESQDEYFGIK